MNRRTFVSGFALGGVAALMGAPSAAGSPVATGPPRWLVSNGLRGVGGNRAAVVLVVAAGSVMSSL